MKFGLVLDQTKQEVIDLSAEIEDFLISRGAEVVRDRENFHGSVAVIVLGGDGTFLHAACENVEFDVPFVGINLGRLGFLTAVDVNEWREAVEKLIEGKFLVSGRLTIEATIEQVETGNQRPAARDQGPITIFRALNEVVVKSNFRALDLDVNIKGLKFLTIVGDGVIVGTQTGSTAYSLSAGGPIVDPAVDSILLTPINAHSLPIPSVVLSPDDVIEISVKKGEDVFLVIDGHEHKELFKGQKVRVSRGKYRVKLGYFDKNQFLKALNAKFGLASRLVG